MACEDRNGNPLSVYPNIHRSKILLGINGDGLAEYFSNDYLLQESTSITNYAYLLQSTG